MCNHHFPGKVCIPDPAHVASDGTGVPVISMDANNGDVFIGGPPGGFGHRGRLVLTNADGDLTYEIDGETGTTSQSGDVVLLDADGNERVRISGQTAEVIIKSAAGNQIVHLDGKTGDITVGGNGQDGDIVVRNSAGNNTVRLDGDTGNVTAGGTLTGQNLVANGATTTQDLTVNGATTTKDITVTNAVGDPTIEVDGEAGDIRLLGADCAEDFDIVGMEKIEPGMVVVLNEQGKVRQSAEAYDKKVAGVISGAGDYRPGIVLDQQVDSQNSRLPVALMGKVYCKVDAGPAPIEAGDLLTTSPTPGHAMKASDPFKAYGAVIGKALRPLESGTGLIPILVTLQ